MLLMHALKSDFMQRHNLMILNIFISLDVAPNSYLHIQHSALIALNIIQLPITNSNRKVMRYILVANYMQE